MKKIAAIILLISLILSSSAFGQDNATRIATRIATLERQVQQLEQRLSKIEESTTSGDTPIHVKVSEIKWKSKANWRKLSTGMSESSVEELLGIPYTMSGGRLAFWYYRKGPGFGGSVTFTDNKLSNWTEPVIDDGTP